MSEEIYQDRRLLARESIQGRRSFLFLAVEEVE